MFSIPQSAVGVWSSGATSLDFFRYTYRQPLCNQSSGKTCTSQWFLQYGKALLCHALGRPAHGFDGPQTGRLNWNGIRTRYLHQATLGPWSGPEGPVRAHRSGLISKIRPYRIKCLKHRYTCGYLVARWVQAGKAKKWLAGVWNFSIAFTLGFDI